MSVREKVLHAAESLFGEFGYDSTSVQNIIDRAGVSKGGLYHHFNSKEMILDQMLHEFAQLLSSKFEQVLNQENDIHSVLNAYANLKQIIPPNKQKVYLEFLFQNNDVYIREKFLQYIRQELSPLLEKSIIQYTNLNNPKVISHLILGLTESVTRLPDENKNNPDFISTYSKYIQNFVSLIIENKNFHNKIE